LLASKPVLHPLRFDLHDARADSVSPEMFLEMQKPTGSFCHDGLLLAF